MTLLGYCGPGHEGVPGGQQSAAALHGLVQKPGPGVLVVLVELVVVLLVLVLLVLVLLVLLELVVVVVLVVPDVLVVPVVSPDVVVPAPVPPAPLFPHATGDSSAATPATRRSPTRRSCILLTRWIKSTRGCYTPRAARIKARAAAIRMDFEGPPRGPRRSDF